MRQITDALLDHVPDVLDILLANSFILKVPEAFELVPELPSLANLLGSNLLEIAHVEDVLDAAVYYLELVGQRIYLLFALGVNIIGARASSDIDVLWPPAHVRSLLTAPGRLWHIVLLVYLS